MAAKKPIDFGPKTYLTGDQEQLGLAARTTCPGTKNNLFLLPEQLVWGPRTT
jgi:hypothetical protein